MTCASNLLATCSTKTSYLARVPAIKVDYYRITALSKLLRPPSAAEDIDMFTETELADFYSPAPPNIATQLGRVKVGRHRQQHCPAPQVAWHISLYSGRHLHG